MKRDDYIESFLTFIESIYPIFLYFISLAIIFDIIYFACLGLSWFFK